MSRIFPALTAALAMIACGVVHGLWTDRWQIASEPGLSAAKLRQKVAGSLFHRYTNRRTGKTVTAFVVCDRPGEIAIHTPDVCYEAAGYEVSKPAQFAPRMAGAEAATFWTARFHKKRAGDASELRIFWSWNAGQGWQAADDPRLAFARFPALFKLYLIRETSGDEPLADDPAVDLMKHLLPELQRVLFASES